MQRPATLGQHRLTGGTWDAFDKVVQERLEIAGVSFWSRYVYAKFHDFFLLRVDGNLRHFLTPSREGETGPHQEWMGAPNADQGSLYAAGVADFGRGT